MNATVLSLSDTTENIEINPQGFALEAYCRHLSYPHSALVSLSAFSACFTGSVFPGPAGRAECTSPGCGPQTLRKRIQHMNTSAFPSSVWTHQRILQILRGPYCSVSGPHPALQHTSFPSLSQSSPSPISDSQDQLQHKLLALKSLLQSSVWGQATYILVGNSNLKSQQYNIKSNRGHMEVQMECYGSSWEGLYLEESIKMH